MARRRCRGPQRTGTRRWSSSLLLEKGLTWSMRDNYGRMPLLLAGENGQEAGGRALTRDRANLVAEANVN